MKKWISILLTLVMLLSLVPMGAIQAAAASNVETYIGGAGSAGTQFKLEIRNDIVSSLGVRDAYLTVSGTGAVLYEFRNLAEKYNIWIRSIKIESGITKIGDGAFSGLTNCRSVSISNTVTTIGSGAFADCFNSSCENLVIPSGVESVDYNAFSGNLFKNVYIDAPKLMAYVTATKNFVDMFGKTPEQVMVKNTITGLSPWFKEHYYKTGATFYNGTAYDIYTHGQYQACNHSYKYEYHTDATQHWLFCAKCGEKGAEPHRWYNRDDTTCVCSVCDYQASHTYSEGWIPNPDSTTSHVVACLKCGGLKQSEVHSYDNVCDALCDACGYTRTIKHDYQLLQDEGAHKYQCTVCGGVTREGEHIWDSECDTICEGCGYVREVAHQYVWGKSNDQHWSECALCAYKAEYQSHSYEDTFGVCSACGFNINEGSFDGGAGTYENPYIIKSLSGLLYLQTSAAGGNRYSGKYIKLAGNITLNDETFTYLPDTGLVKVSDGIHMAYLGTGYCGAKGGNTVFDTEPSVAGAWYASDSSTEIGEYGGTLLSWTPISYFRGTFIGDGYTISGLYVNIDADNSGLFGSTSGGEINTLYVKNGYIRGDFNVGAIAGTANAIADCFADAVVCGYSSVGGVAGSAGKIVDSTNKGVALCYGYQVGGVAGYTAEISRCYNYGDVYGGDQAGGVVGWANVTRIEKCGNIGDVYGKDKVGGVVGDIHGYGAAVTISQCVNEGDITGEMYVAGVAGHVASATIVSSSNIGNVSGVDRVAGIVAYATGSCSVDKCFNRQGRITGEDGVGGIAATFNNGGSIEQSYNESSVTATVGSAAGIVVTLYRATVKNCYNVGAIQGASSAGGIVGSFSSSGTTIQNCYNYSTVYTTNAVVDSTLSVGGIAAYGIASGISNCYYWQGKVYAGYKTSSQKAGRGIGNETADTKGVTTALSSMTGSSSYTGFDFTNIWSGSYNSAPSLKNVYHSYHSSNNWEQGALMHWKTCSCGYRLALSVHKYDGACDTTCDTCGYTREISHAFSTEWISQGEETHAQVCASCGEIKDNVPHIYDGVCDNSCNACGYMRTAPHSYAEEYLNDGEMHWHACTLCETLSVPEVHAYSNDCDDSCNRCGYVRNAGHIFETKYDKKNHWKQCYRCAVKVMAEEHIYDNGCDSWCNGCYYIRTVPDHVYDSACDAECNECNQFRTVPDHEYDNDCDAECNVCGGIRTVPDHMYDNVCDTTCNVCGGSRLVPDHVYDNTCDATCNECGAVRSIRHNYDNDCDITCNLCGGERVPEPHKVRVGLGTLEYVRGFVLGADGYYTSNPDYASQPIVYIDIAVSGRFYVHYRVSNTESNTITLGIARNGDRYVYTTENGEVTHLMDVVKGDRITIYVDNNGRFGGRSTASFNVENSLIREVSADEVEEKCLSDIVCCECGVTVKEAAGHTYTNDCDKTCNRCGTVRTEIRHTYDHDCDTSCNVCGEERVTTHVYDNGCDAVCNICGDDQRDDIVHTYDNNCDGVCNICSYERTPAEHQSEVVRYILLNDGKYPFVFDSETGYYHSTNKVDWTTSAMTLRVLDYTGSLTIKYYTSSQSGDTLSLRQEGYTGTGLSGISSYVREKTFTVKPGDVITITYSKDNYASAGDDCGYFMLVTPNKGAAAEGQEGQPTCEDAICCAECGVLLKEALGHTYTGDCDAECNRCEAVRVAADHVYDNDRDADCNICGAKREVAGLPGDGNGDGKVNNRDLGLLQQYLNDWEVTIDLTVMDVNDDGRINNRDLGLLQQYLNDWDVELK